MQSCHSSGMNNIWTTFHPAPLLKWPIGACNIFYVTQTHMGTSIFLFLELNDYIGRIEVQIFCIISAVGRTEASSGSGEPRSPSKAVSPVFGWLLTGGDGTPCSSTPMFLGSVQSASHAPARRLSGSRAGAESCSAEQDAGRLSRWVQPSIGLTSVRA